MLFRSFIAKPVLYTTYSRASYISPRTRQTLSYVLVKAREGVDPAALAARIERETDLRARTASQFKDDTYWYYVFLTGVVSRIIFMISTAVVVGLSVSSLLFYLFTTENARYYAALMALGCRGRTLVAMVVVQVLLAKMDLVNMVELVEQELQMDLYQELDFLQEDLQQKIILK